MGRMLYRFYAEKINFIEHKRSIIALLNKVCNDNYEVVSLFPNYFIVNTDYKLVDVYYSNERGRSVYSNPETKFISYLFDAIPEIDNTVLFANEYVALDNRKVTKCYMVENSGLFNLNSSKTMDAIQLDENDLKSTSKISLTKKCYIPGIKYLYVGDVNIKCDPHERYLKYEIGKQGCVYVIGFGNNLYMLNKFNEENSKIYKTICFGNMKEENNYLEEKYPAKLDYKIVINNTVYNVYQPSLEYNGSVGQCYNDSYNTVSWKYCGYGRLIDDYIGIYEGQFDEGEFDGFGTLFNKDKEVVYKGRWYHGRREGE